MSPAGEELARRIRRGDRAAFDDLFDRWASGLLGYLVGMVGDRATAEDLVQETLLRVYRHIGRYQERGAFRAWVFRIATNLALTELRRRRYRAAGSLDSRALEVADPGTPDPEDLCALRDRERLLEEAMGTLTDDERAVLLLRIREGMRIQDVARALGLPAGTIKSRIHHAVRKLRQYVDREEAPLGPEGRHDELR